MSHGSALDPMGSLLGRAVGRWFHASCAKRSWPLNQYIYPLKHTQKFRHVRILVLKIKYGLVYRRLLCFVLDYMADKLTEIMAWKRQEIADLVRPVELSELADLNRKIPTPPSFANALQRDDCTLAVIAEIKRRSPSAGEIASIPDAPTQARRYQAAEADCMSILTDYKYFGGTLADLESVTQLIRESPPQTLCLRKDFMVHPIQVREARLSGASAILIIVRALDDQEIGLLQESATAAGLDALYEIHSEPELARAVAHGAKIIGVNNRDLAIFRTDLGLSESLIPMFPKGVIAISESGIHTAEDAKRAKDCGAHAVLVGESLMKAANPAELVRSFR